MPSRHNLLLRTGTAFLLVSLLVVAGTALAAGKGAEANFAPETTSSTSPEHANGTLTELPSLSAFRLDGMEIKIDGVLDEAVWDMAETGWGFQEHDPDRGQPASVPTTFKVAYDDDAIYFAVACWENDVADIQSYLGRRDEIEASDIVSIYIDPYHDRTTSYNFRVNPSGVQQDAYIFDNGNRDRDWNAVWESEVSRDEKGWYVEVRIPFSAIRFKPSDDMTWGMQVYRWLHGRGEDTGWVLWDRNSSGFVSRWGLLTDLRGVDNPRKLEVLPYVSTKHIDPAIEGEEDQWQNSQTFGADFKYGVTSNLTLNATFQPDFGQVEADPATLNLSPIETFFQEKRPFFTEGARFFQHPEFNLFYSRRIGTGDPNSRIRGAAKLTGKVGGDVSLAFLGAATDVGVPGKVHNPFVGGDQKAYYGLVRMGKEFNEGNHRVNVMGTAVKRNEASFAGVDNDRLQRDGYSAGLDFEMNFDDRMYRVKGSAVSTKVDPFAANTHPYLQDGSMTGTGGGLEIAKRGGKWRGELGAKWESDKLDSNDMGFMSAPDEWVYFSDVSYNYDSDGEDKPFNRIEVELEAYTSTLYGAGSGSEAVLDYTDPDGVDHYRPGDEAWSYDERHHQSTGVHFNVWGQHRSFHQGWIFMGRAFDGTNKYTTRWNDIDQRGPLMSRPAWTNVAGGITTDWRKPVSLRLEFHYDHGDKGLRGYGFEARLNWQQSEHFTHSLGFGLRDNRNVDQWMFNQVNDGSQTGVTGIGNVDYVFGKLDQKTWDLTLRSNILFNRDHSLQLYLQPFLTYGNYVDPSWLASPDSYDLRPYGIDASEYDFNFGALNLNLVYRWEYRPGSTFYLVWAHSKSRWEERWESQDPLYWNNAFDPAFLVDAEPENTIMAKLSYWFSI